MNRDNSGCPKGLTKGVILEILWDIERHPTEGRRATQKITESVWWRAEVLDPMEDDDITQLRWRFFESSGIVSCDLDCEDTRMIDGSGSHIEDGSSFLMMKQRMDELSGRIQHVERLALSERKIVSQVSRSLRTNEDHMGGLLALMRQKLAFNAQKPLISPKGSTYRDAPPLIDYSCTGSLRATIDCSADEFESLSQMIRNQNVAAQFRADYRSTVPSIGVLKASTSVAEVIFGSLKDLCEALGITQRADRLAIAWRKRFVMSNARPHEVAVRISGTFLSERWRDDTPSIILVFQGIREDMAMSSEVIMLSRKDTKVDSRIKWYRKPLQLQRSPVAEALGAVFSVTEGDEPRQIPLSKTGYTCLVQQLANGIGCFALRWKRLPNLNAKLWTRKINSHSSPFGTLEVEVPYLHVRGAHAVSEIENLLTKDVMFEIIN